MKRCAYLAVYKILPDALASSAYPTVLTMIDTLRAIVIPQLADVAIVPCPTLPTPLAPLTGGLRSVAKHTQHVLCGAAIEMVRVLFGIVAVPARVPLLAVEALDLDVAFVVFAAQGGGRRGDVLVRWAVCGKGPIGGQVVFGLELVWVLQVHGKGRCG
jgi:hypothetical protein